MRTSSIIVLLLTLVVGTVFARFIGQFMESEPNTSAVKVVENNLPEAKILVAKVPIAVGQEILAEHIAYATVPVSELPERAITNFNEAYRRRPAFPIPVDCPICEDLLIAKDDDDSNKNSTKFIPAGYTIVSLDIEWLNKRNRSQFSEKRFLTSTQPNTQHDFASNINHENNNELSLQKSGVETNEPRSLLAKGNRVDIRVIKKHAPNGTHASIKEQVLQTYAERINIETISELVLEDISIHNFTNYGHNNAGKSLQKVSFLLENSKAELLAAAAKKGRLRMVAHQAERKELIEQIENKISEPEIAANNNNKKYANYFNKKNRTRGSKTTQNNETIATTQNINTQNEINQTDNNNQNNQAQNNITPTTTTKNIDLANASANLTTPDTTKDTTTTKSTASRPSLLVLPLLLRGMFDTQPLANTNSTNKTKNNKTDQDNEYNNVGFAMSHGSKYESTTKQKQNLIHNSTKNNTNKFTEVIDNNTTKPTQVLPVLSSPTYDADIDNNDSVGWSSTRNYAIGHQNNNTKNEE
ncbi:MAG: hypothetical protein LBQ66_09545 [Planctomycetaceae bacterium]|jgi:hypothetical protein|nr:hypothetical protein [Planctomycetaceae bacterium]